MVEVSIKVPGICQVVYGKTEGRLKISDFIYLSYQMLFQLMLWQIPSVRVFLAGFKLIGKLILSSKDLIPVDMRMHSADNHVIAILGAVILTLSGRNQLGDERMTR